MRRPAAYRPIASLVVATLILFLALTAMEQTLVPRAYAIALTALYLAVAFLTPALGGGTTKAGRFLFCEQDAPANSAALAGVTSIALPALTLSGIGLYLANPQAAVMLAFSATAGSGLAALFILRPFRETQTSDLAELMHVVHGGTVAARTGAFIAAFVLGALLVGAISGGATLLAWFFGLSRFAAFLIFALCAALAAATGGMQSVIRTGAMSAGLFIGALTLVLCFFSITMHGFPVGQLTFGISAIEPLAEFEAQLRSAGLPGLSSSLDALSPASDWPPIAWAAAGLLGAFGVASLPQLMQVFSASRSPVRASAASARLILFAGLAGLSVVAIAAYSHLGIYQALLGITAEDARFAAPVLYEWGGRAEALLTVCGTTPDSHAALLEACGADRPLTLADIGINALLASGAAADLSGQSFAFTAILVSALIALACAFSAMAALSLSGNLVTAFHAIRPRHVASRRVFLVRTAVLFTMCIAALRAYWGPVDIISGSVFSLGLCAAALGPALLATLHWKGVGTPAVTSAMIGGLMVSMLHLVFTTLGMDLVAGTGDEMQFALPGSDVTLPPALAGITGLPASILLLAGVAAMDRFGVFGNREKHDPDGVPGADEAETRSPEAP